MPADTTETTERRLLAPPGTHPLERLLQPAWRVGITDGEDTIGYAGPRIDCRPGDGAPEWLHSGAWRVFARPERPVGRGRRCDRVLRTRARRDAAARVDASTGDVIVPFSLAEAYLSYVSEAWRESGTHRSLSAGQLRAYYALKKLVPRAVQLTARRALIRAQGVPAFPSWPGDTSVSTLAAVLRRMRAAGRGPARGILHLVLARRTTRGDHPHARRRGRRRHPSGSRARRPRGVPRISLLLQLRCLVSDRRGRAPRAPGPGLRGRHARPHARPPAVRLARGVRGAAARPGGARRAPRRRRVQVTGDPPRVRRGSPSCRSSTTARSRTRIRTSRSPGGCCSVWPFFVGPVVELPYTLPQDHTLLTLLRHRSPQLWLDQAAKIESAWGLIQCVSHPDPGYLGDADKRAVYAEFLQGMAERTNVWRALPRDVAAWWRERDTADSVAGRMRSGTVSLTDAGAVLSPPA